jgi:hypothetical protein
MTVKSGMPEGDGERIMSLESGHHRPSEELSHMNEQTQFFAEATDFLAAAVAGGLLQHFGPGCRFETFDQYMASAKDLRLAISWGHPQSLYTVRAAHLLDSAPNEQALNYLLAWATGTRVHPAYLFHIWELARLRHFASTGEDT